VADLAREVGLVQQIRLMVGLRWRLLHNGMRRKNNRLDLIGLMVLSVFAGAFVIGVSAAFFAGAYQSVSNSRYVWVDLQFWAIFLWWQAFPIFMAGFGANFEMRSLLRFPLTRSAFYVMGMAYGLADFGPIAGLCWVVSLAAGTVSAAPNLLPATVGVAAAFVLFNVALERLIGSWIERVLAKRRAREVFFAVFILLMMALQLAGPLMSRHGGATASWMIRLMPVISLLPPSLAGRALENAAIGDVRAALLNTARIFLYFAIVAGLLWVRFAAQYRGEEISETPAPDIAASGHTSFEATQNLLDLVSPQVAAIVRKEFRYLVRNGFAALLLFVPPLLVFMLIRLARSSAFLTGDALFPGLMAYLVLMLMSPTYNSFAYEGPGIQAYFTAPLSFRKIFLAKNFVQAALLISELALCVAAFAYGIGLPSPPVLFATLAAIAFTVIGQFSIANWSSLNFPRKLAFGQIHGQRQSGMAVLIAFGVQILLFAISAVVFLLGRWTADPWLPAEAFALLTVAALGGYSASLNALNSLAEKKKERLIEALCR
jgi:ABC-2 type transport system permease protein